MFVRVVREVEGRQAELYRLALRNFEVLVDAQVRVEERGSRDGGPNERTVHAPDRGLREAIGVEILTRSQVLAGIAGKVRLKGYPVRP